MKAKVEYVAAFLALVCLISLSGWTPEPGPGPGPTPPSERLIDVDGVAVLVVYQDTDLANYTQQQRNIIAGQDWTDHADDWRVLDAQAAFTGDSPYKAVFSRAPANLPWCVVSGAGTQHEGELPATVADMVQLVEAAK